MARRFGSAIISNTDSTLFIYFYAYMLVKEYNAWATAFISQPAEYFQQTKRRR